MDSNDVPDDQDTARIQELTDRGGRLDWWEAGRKIVFDRKGSDGCYNVWVMDGNGENKQCISCDIAELRGLNVGQPTWHPSGLYIVVQVEKAIHVGKRCGLATNPGAGVHNDLWTITLASKVAQRIHKVDDGKDHGTLHPHFSKDGARLSWAELNDGANLFVPGKEFGFWSLKVANVEGMGETAKLAQIESYTPNGTNRWYENHGFSPDGHKLIFTGSEDQQKVQEHANIYVYDLTQPNTPAVQLTDQQYNEHGHFSPDGKRMVWMSGRDVWATDYWLMQADGSQKKQVTFFNIEGSPDYRGNKVVTADFVWKDDGSHIIAYAHLIPQWEKIFHIRIE